MTHKCHLCLEYHAHMHCTGTGIPCVCGSQHLLTPVSSCTNPLKENWRKMCVHPLMTRVCVSVANVLVAPLVCRDARLGFLPPCFLPACDGGRAERDTSVFMSRSCSFYDWCFPLHAKEGANSIVEKGEALGCNRNHTPVPCRLLI